MSSVILNRLQLEGDKQENINNYRNQENYKNALEIIAAFNETFVDDNRAIFSDNYNESNSDIELFENEGKIGLESISGEKSTVHFSFEFDADSKELTYIILNANDRQIEFIELEEISNLSNNEDVLYDIIISLNIKE